MISEVNKIFELCFLCAFVVKPNYRCLCVLRVSAVNRILCSLCDLHLHCDLQSQNFPMNAFFHNGYIEI
jgi:hypothetical protein